MVSVTELRRPWTPKLNVKELITSNAQCLGDLACNIVVKTTFLCVMILTFFRNTTKEGFGTSDQILGY